MTDAKEFEDYERNSRKTGVVDRFDDDNSLYGAMEAREQKIYLAPEMADDITIDTLLHEVLHAIIFCYAADWENEETIVSVLSPGILDTLRRNPDLVAALVSGL